MGLLLNAEIFISRIWKLSAQENNVFTQMQDDLIWDDPEKTCLPKENVFIQI